MINSIEKLVRAFFCFAFLLIGVYGNAQVFLLQNAIAKIDSYKNFSYQSINKQKELFDADTTKEQRRAVFFKASEDKKSGNLFKINTVSDHNPVGDMYIYNGQRLLHLSPADSTYQIQEVESFNFQTLVGCLAWINNRLIKKQSGLTKVRDTIVNTVVSYHLIANVYDTVIHNKRNYTTVNLCIDKSSGLPNCIIIKSINTTFGDGVSSYYSESSYFDYKFNQANVTPSLMTIPDGYHPPKAVSVLPTKEPQLLTLETIAPYWVLHDETGRKTSLDELKGKVVLLDFFFIGCFGCMESLKPLNNLHEKYKNQNVSIVSMTFRDNARAVTQFKNDYNIKYPIYIDAADVVTSYQVTAFPTFYFINKEGKIANVIVGCSENFEEKVSFILDNMLSK